MVGDAGPRPAWYAASRERALSQWWTILHPPYTLWHLAYVVLGASLASRLDVVRLLATLLAFALAVGVGAHALDELHGRPLRTDIPSSVLLAAAALAVGGAVALGVVGSVRVGPALLAFVAVGTALVTAYNLELFGRAIHNRHGFALAWGSFPVLTAYFAETGRLSVASGLAAVGTYGLSLAQTSLSTPARRLRRRAVEVSGVLTLDDSTSEPLGRAVLLEPLETALRTLSWATVVLAAAVAFSHLG